MSREEELKDIEIANLRGSYDYAVKELREVLGITDDVPRALEYYVREACQRIRFLKRKKQRREP
jgi:hypothetical protein